MHSGVVGYRAILISSYSGVSGESFASLVREQLDVTKDSFIYVPTAKFAPDASSTRSKGEQRRRARYDAKQKMALLVEELSLKDPVMLELDSPTMTPDTLREALANAQLIFVDGGNTFYLQKYVLQLNFWGAARASLSNGGVYVGQSAGGIIAGQSIRTAFWKGWDDPKAAGIEWTDENLRGAGIADFSVFMHHEAQYEELVANRRGELGHGLQTLTNNEAFLLRSGQPITKFRVKEGIVTNCN